MKISTKTPEGKPRNMAKDDGRAELRMIQVQCPLPGTIEQDDLAGVECVQASFMLPDGKQLLLDFTPTEVMTLARHVGSVYRAAGLTFTPAE